MKRTQTLIDECERMTRHVCKLLDSGADSRMVEAARAARDAKLALIHSRHDGRNYDRGYT